MKFYHCKSNMETKNSTTQMISLIFTPRYMPKLILIVLSVMFIHQSVAQSTDRNITVEREFKPIIQDAGKLSTTPSVIDATVQKTNPQYNEFNLPLSVGRNVQLLGAAEPTLDPSQNPDDAFLRIGAGNYYNNMLHFALPLIKTSATRMDVRLNHLATLGNKLHSNSNLSLNLNNYLKNAELKAGVETNIEFFNYYGKVYNSFTEFNDFSFVTSNPTTVYKEKTFTRISRNHEFKRLNYLTNLPINEQFFNFNSYVGFNSAAHKTGLRFETLIDYNYFDTRNGLTEHALNTRAGFNTVNGKNRMGIDMDMKNMLYSSDLPRDSINVWDAYTVVGLNPFYSFERKTWNVRLGVKTSFSFIHGRPFSPSPDIFVEWRAVPKWLAIYAGAGGGYDVNNLSQTMHKNRYLHPDLRIKDTYTPIHTYAGIKLKPIHNLLLDAYVSYRYIDNQYFYVHKDYEAITQVVAADKLLYTNRYNVVYSIASLTNVGLRANYNIRNTLNVQLNGVYNGWRTANILHAWQKPAFEADLTAEYRVNRQLIVNTSVFYKSERKAVLGNKVMPMNAFVDINLGLSYNINNSFSVFARGHNLLNSKYDAFFGYEVQGINCMVGAAISF